MHHLRRDIVGLTTLSVVLVLTGGCQLVVGFDRDRIDGAVPLDGRVDAAEGGRDAGDGGRMDADASDPCQGVVCDQPPEPTCEGSEAVVADGETGTCVVEDGEAVCEYDLVRTDCAETDEVCTDGACTDPCEGVVCDEPPAPTCDGLTTRVEFAATGTCSSPGGDVTCTYARTETDCSLTDQFCDAGVCVDEDPCEGVTCTTAPSPICEDLTAVTFAETGTCSSPEGEPVCAYARTESDCASMDLGCTDGACVDPCIGFDCSTPPAATCEGNTQVTFGAAGTCSSPGGIPACAYPRTETDCALSSQVCQDGACVDPDPCAGVTCDTPPSAMCDGATAVTFASTGTCSEGTCTYPQTDTDCAATDQACDEGACVDPCVGFECSTPPAATCDGSMAVTYASTGTCASPGGVPSCSFAETRTDCAATDQACSEGACVDPCVGFDCTTPPAASCDGSTAVTYASAGTCASPGGVPSCSFAETRTNCAATDQACSEGACVDPCVGFDCTTPPAAECDGDNAVTYASTGTCSSPSGVPSCTYAPTSTDCTETDQACSDGSCVDPCVGFACTTPPAASCDANVAVTYGSTGSCTSPGGTAACEYARTETDCAMTSQVCVDGVCTDPDPCEGVTCDVPPAATCAGMTAVSFASTGTCSGGSCSYEQTETDCAAMNMACSEGACVDPCVGFTCTTPPAAECDGSNAVTYASTGTCSSPGGVPSCTYAPTSTDCAAMNMACSMGACVDPCVGFACTTPPADECMGSTAVTYAEAGTCSSPGGVPSCAYAPTSTDCAATNMACSMGACVDPCFGFECNDPPAAECMGSTAVTYAAEGMCTSPGGVPGCSYMPTATECTDIDLVCAMGSCVSPCTSESCTTAPDAVCEGNSLRTYTAPGACSSPGGVVDCSFDSSLTNCGELDRQCLSGACVDPCAAHACETPPADHCDGDVAVTYPMGMCVSPDGVVDCDYPEVRTDCATGGRVCDSGQCVDPILTITSCRLQWPPTISGEAGEAAGPVYGRVTIVGYTDQTAGNESPQNTNLIAQFGYGDTADAPSTWTSWANAEPNPGWMGAEAGADEFWYNWILPGHLGSYDYAYRFSGDGGMTWTYCDLDAGSTDGYSADDAGKATVTEVSWTFVDTFDNRLDTSTYSNFTFAAVVPDVEWAVVHGRNEDMYAIDGPGVMLRRASEPSSITATLPNGVGSLAVDVRKAFTGDTERRLEVIVGSTVVATFTHTFPSGASTEVAEIRAINVNQAGPVTVTIRVPGTDSTNRQVVLDNFRWTPYP